MRRTMPRFHGANFEKNLELVKELDKIAKQKGCTSAQLAISWVKYMSNEIGVPVIPIPGATKQERVTENSEGVTLTTGDAAEIRSVLQSFTTSGQRYGEAGMAHVEG